MTKDAAAFDREALRRIYGESPQCFICPRYKAQDFHHIFSRRKRDGFGREIFSSPFNAAPISRDIHDTCPFLGIPDFQMVLFVHAVKHVNYSIARGQYEPTTDDVEFLRWVGIQGEA